MILTARRSHPGLSRLVLALLVVLATFAAGAGVLSVTAQGEDTIYGCAHKNSGNLRIVGGPGDCKSNETALSWSTGGTAAPVHWDDIEGIPLGIEDQVAEDVQCDGCVGSVDIEDMGIQSMDLGAGSVTNEKLAEGSVTTVKLAEGNVTTDKLANESVITAKLHNNSVTAEKLAANSVDSAAIVNGSITSDDLAAGSVTESKLGPGSVRGGPGGVIVNSSITTDELADDSVGASEIQSGAVGTDELANNSVDGNKIVDSSITGNEVADGSLTGADIADGSITSQDIRATYSTGSESAVVIISDSGLAGHAVLVSADAKVECIDSSFVSGCNGTIIWQLQDGATPVGTDRSLRVALINGEELQIVAQDIAYALDGTHEYSLHLMYVAADGSSIDLTKHMVIAVDLGRN